jgi:hypothetical protein
MTEAMKDLSAAVAKARRPRGKKRFSGPKQRNKWEHPMDDIQVFKPVDVPKNEVVLGTYGSYEWIEANLRRSRWLLGQQTLETNTTWLTPAGFKLADWVVEMGFPSFTFFSASHVVVATNDGHISINVSKSKIDVGLTGDIQFCNTWDVFFASRFKKAENLIRWVYNARGDDISVPLNYRPAVQAAYPWIKQPLADYIKGYLYSEACVLILIGPPGTGKTTFIKNIIHQSGGDARVAYDETVLKGDDFFAAFIDGEDDVLVMEDADSFLADRQDGNTMMHKFLNVSDGLISTIGKKMIFSTNLPNINDIDPALMRTGRCYDVLQFRPLQRAEAQAVLDEVKSDRPLEDGATFTLAEIFSSQPSADSTVRRGIGFIS